MKRAFLLSVLLLLVVGCGSTPKFSKEQGTRTKGFVLRSMESEGKTRRYSVYVPSTPPPAGGYPVILNLHGAGEGGGDGKRPTAVGIGPQIAKKRGNFDFLVVFPQVRGGNWSNRRSAQVAVDALDDAIRDFGGSPDRVIVTGYSTGGQGTYYVGGLHASRFAALVPMCGWRSPESVERIKHLPIWISHNRADWAVPHGKSRDMVRRLEEAGARNVKLTSPGSVGHDVWVKAFNDDNLYAWMKQQRRR